MWGGYFFLPFFFLLLLQMTENPENRSAPVLVGLVLAAMLLQGSSHAFVWCVLFLLLMFVFGAAPRRRTAEALLWSAGLGLFRLAPAAAILLGRRVQAFETGYPSLVDFLAGLVWVHDATVPRRGSGSMGGLHWWEFDTFIGLPALVWLVAFGVVFGLVRGRTEWRRLSGPVAVMAALSLGRLYLPFTAWKIPLLSSQRVSSRLLIVPVGLLVVLAAAAGDEWMRRVRRGRAVIVACVVLTAVLLAWHSYTWSVPRVAEKLPPPPKPRRLEVTIVEPPSPLVGRDALYRAVVVGAALTSLGVATFGAFRLRSVRCR